MRRFELHEPGDPDDGGDKIVAEGVMFSDDFLAIRWMFPYGGVEVVPAGIEAFGFSRLADGYTLVWLDKDWTVDEKQHGRHVLHDEQVK